MNRFLCAVIAAGSSAVFAEGERAVWTLYSGNVNTNGLTAVTWLAADGVETTTSIDSEADYVVSSGKTIYISSSSSPALNIFNGHSLWTYPIFQPEANSGSSGCISAVPGTCRLRHHLPHLLKSRAMPSAIA